MPRSGFPSPLGAEGELALDGLVGAGAGPGPEAARVVVVDAAARVVAVVELARPDLPAVVPVVADDTAAPGTAAGGATVVAVVSAVGTPDVVVLLGGPAMANWPPRRNEGGPLWVTLYPITPAARTVTEAAPARTFTRKERPCNTGLGPPSGLTALIGAA